MLRSAPAGRPDATIGALGAAVLTRVVRNNLTLLARESKREPDCSPRSLFDFVKRSLKTLHPDAVQKRGSDHFANSVNNYNRYLGSF